MSYGEFTMESLQKAFGLRYRQADSLFADIPEVALSEEAEISLRRFKALALAIDTEKARSEYIVAPLLGELKLTHRERIALFSGIEFNVDRAAGLIGRCDFILARSAEQYFLKAPVVVLLEAKNDNIKSGIPQCAAEMVAAQRFNQAKEMPIETIYGGISTGTIWKFLALTGNVLTIDTEEYYIDAPEKIMGILTKMVLGEG